MQHLEEGTIHAWLDGALSSEESARVEQHAAQCAECAAMVADARGIIAGAARIVSALDIVPGGVIPKKQSAPGRPSVWRVLRLTPFRAALAASLMVAAASLVVVRQSSNNAPLSRPQPAIAAKAMDSSLALAAPTRTSAPAPANVALSPTPASGHVAASAPPPPMSTMRAGVDRAMAKAEARTTEERKPAPTNFADSLRRANEPRPQTAVAVAAPSAAAPAPAQPVAVADARRIAAQPTPDSAARVTSAGIAGAAAAAGAPGLQTRKALQLQSVVVGFTDPAPIDFIGCYEINRDSINWPSSLPARFALEKEPPSEPTRNVVRTVEADGRLADLVTGATWELVGNTMAHVTWSQSPAVSGGNRSSQLLVLSRGLTGFTVQATFNGQTRTVPAVRLSCRR